jgi:hypothetical protein
MVHPITVDNSPVHRDKYRGPDTGFEEVSQIGTEKSACVNRSLKLLEAGKP